MTALVPMAPSRQDLEAMPLAERVALEDAFGQAHDLIRELNDADIERLVAEGKTQTEIAEIAGLSQQRISQRCARMGVEPVSGRGRPRITSPSNSNGDGPHDEPEVVDAEVVADDPDARPVQYLPDVVSADAETNVRTQALVWFEQGRRLKELLDEGATVDPRSRDDKAAIKREAAEMGRVARQLKGAF